jgi:hypothetical protein
MPPKPRAQRAVSESVVPPPPVQVPHSQLAEQVCVPPAPQACVVLGVQAPSPTQLDHPDHVPLSQVRLWLPQLPQAWVEEPEQVWPVHAPHWQLALHVSVPPEPHACVASGVQAPAAPQADQPDHTPAVQSRVRVPQLPQASLDGPGHVWFSQPFHWQLVLQVWVPPSPQACVAPLVQTPSPVQADQPDHVPFSHVRARVPQLPQASLAGPAQVCPVQRPHWHAAAQAWVPPVPHAWVLSSVQTPSPAHADQADHVPPSQVRVCVPQFPQACVVGPWQVGACWQASHWHVPVHVRVPPEPHASDAFGAHAPSASQAPQSDQTPSLQARERVPQLPQDDCEGPSHVFGVSTLTPTNARLKCVVCAVAFPFAKVVRRGSKRSVEPGVVQKTLREADVLGSDTRIGVAKVIPSGSKR